MIKLCLSFVLIFLFTVTVNSQHHDFEGAHFGEEHSEDDGVEFGEHEDIDESLITELTDTSFISFVESHPIVLVEFYANWCMHCQHLRPIYAEASRLLADEKEIALAKIEATANTNVAQTFEIEGFPTLKLFKNGEFISDYTGQRTSSSIANYLKRQTIPSITTLSSKNEIKSSLQSTELSIIAILTPTTPTITPFLEKFANSIQESYSVAFIINSEIYNELGGNEGDIVLISKFGFNSDSGFSTEVFGKFENILKGDKEYIDQLRKWVEVRKFPVFGILSDETFSDYLSSELPLLLVLSQTEENNEYIDLVQSVAPEIRTQGVLSCYVGVGESEMLIRELGLNENEIPILIIDGKDETHYLFGKRELNKESIKTFVNEFIFGELIPSYRSEEIPLDNNGFVKIIVGNSFNQIVMNGEKDSFVLFYTKWCPHCQKFVPVLDQVANKLQGISQIVFGKFDVSDNDIPRRDIRVEQVPDVRMFTLQGTMEVYSGSGSVEDVVKFIHSHATVKFELPEFTEEDKIELADGIDNETPNFDDILGGMEEFAGEYGDLEEDDEDEELNQENPHRDEL